jgi:hypothetical protein
VLLSLLHLEIVRLTGKGRRALKTAISQMTMRAIASAHRIYATAPGKLTRATAFAFASSPRRSYRPVVRLFACPASCWPAQPIAAPFTALGTYIILGSTANV